MSTTSNTWNPTAESIKAKAGETATNVADKAKQAADTIKTRAGEVASNMAERAQQTASSIGQQAEDATHAVGSSMKTLADTVRQRGPQSGMAGSATSSIAQGLESGGQYLEQEGLKGIAEDVTNLIRRNPLPALVLGVGLGFILARATARK